MNHSYAADVGYGGPMGKVGAPGERGSWEGKVFWTARDLAHSITFRDLRAVRLLLHRHFSYYVSDPYVRRFCYRRTISQ